MLVRALALAASDRSTYWAVQTSRPNGVILTKGYDVPYNYPPLTIWFFLLPTMQAGLVSAHPHLLHCPSGCAADRC